MVWLDFFFFFMTVDNSVQEETILVFDRESSLASTNSIGFVSLKSSGNVAHTAEVTTSIALVHKSHCHEPLNKI